MVISYPEGANTTLIVLLEAVVCIVQFSGGATSEKLGPTCCSITYPVTFRFEPAIEREWGAVEL